MIDQLKQLQKIMEQEKADSMQARAKVESDKVALVKEMTATKAEAEKLKKELAAL